MRKNKIVVFGSLDDQGKAVITSLLQSNIGYVIALSTDAHSHLASCFRFLGADVVNIDTINDRLLSIILENTYGVYIMTRSGISCSEQTIGLQESEKILKACKAAHVGHIILSSFINFNNPSGIDVVDNRILLEGQMESLGIPFTILRSSVYMEDIIRKAGRFDIVYGNFPRTTKVPCISLADLGRLVVEIFNNASKYSEKIVDAIVDFKSGKDIAEALSSLGDRRKYRYISIPSWLVFLVNKDVWKLRKYFKEMNSAEVSKLIQSRILHLNQAMPGNLTIRKVLANHFNSGKLDKN